MQLYLPIAEVSVNAFLILGLGGIVGFLSGMFGVGGGFLITPLLFFIGVPPAVAVATGANQVVASSVSGVLAQLRRKGVDFHMGTVLLLGGFVGSAIGVWVFAWMTRLGQVDLFVQLSYVLFLGLIGAMMLQESLRSLLRSRKPGGAPIRRAHVHSWVHGLPFKMKFRASGLYISVIPPALIGAAVGFLAAIMGVGGGFILVPAMIYLLGMPTKVVIGTSLFQIIFVTGLHHGHACGQQPDRRHAAGAASDPRRRHRRADRHQGRRPAEGGTAAHPVVAAGPDRRDPHRGRSSCHP
jgi:uncharacterized membrane protein YfcA